MTSYRHDCAVQSSPPPFSLSLCPCPLPDLIRDGRARQPQLTNVIPDTCPHASRAKDLVMTQDKWRLREHDVDVCIGHFDGELVERQDRVRHHKHLHTNCDCSNTVVCETSAPTRPYH